MKRLFAIFAFALICSPSFATVGSKTVWNVDAGAGANTNGGACDYGVATTVCGTVNDDSLVAGTAITCTLASSTTATCSPAISSTTHGPGNIIEIASGAGCTTGAWYEIISQSAGTATFDKVMGTTGNVCVGVIGGQLSTIGQAVTNAISGNAITVKKATYTITTVMQPKCVVITGYNSSPGDLSGTWPTTTNYPTITTATNSTPILEPTANCLGDSFNFAVKYFIISNTASTRDAGIQAGGANEVALIDSVVLDGLSIGIDGSTHTAFLGLLATNVEIKNTTKCGIINNGFMAYGAYVHGNATAAPCSGQGVLYDPSSSTSTIVDHGIFYSNTGIAVSKGGAGGYLQATNNVFDANQVGLVYVGSPATAYVANNVFYGQTTGTATGLSLTGTVSNNWTQTFYSLYNNAFGNNTHNTNGSTTTGTGAITLSGDPFTNASGGDFSLNPTAGAGAALKAAGFPTKLAAGNTSTYYDVNAAQAQGSSGSSSGGSYMVQQ